MIDLIDDCEYYDIPIVVTEDDRMDAFKHETDLVIRESLERSRERKRRRSRLRQGEVDQLLYQALRWKTRK